MGTCLGKVFKKKRGRADFDNAAYVTDSTEQQQQSQPPPLPPSPKPETTIIFVLCNMAPSATIRPWPVRAAQRRMFSLQQSLPRLPVPPLQQTLDKYIQSMTPILSEEELQRAKKLTSELLVEGSAGQQLQQALEQRAREKVNWLEEWWLNCAYLEYRLPCPIHVNPGVTFGIEKFKTPDDQLRHAAKLVAGVLDYKCMVDDQTLQPEYMGKKPLCMSQYFKILSACRIPKPGRDSVVVFPPDQVNPPRHITVIRNNNLFSLKVYGSDDSPLTEEQLFDRLKDIYSRSQTQAPPIGILTADERDVWAKNYDVLTKDPQNRANLEEIQRSIFALCLDGKSPRDGKWSEATVNARVMNHGGGSDYGSSNRWFDKTLQFIVGEDGVVGLNYEHSTAEGPPIISLCDHTLTYISREHGYQTPVPGIQPAKHLEFNINDQISTAMYNAAHNFDKVVNNLDLHAFTVKDFGKDFIKSHKLSPDGFIQVGLQLTYFRIHNRNTTTYESGSLRQFQNGRTDTIRSCSIATDKYVRAMGDETTTVEQRATLLREAINQHRAYTNAVIQGQGIDRHLLGLKLISSSAGIDLPAFFTDPIYAKSFHFSVSTSQVPSRYDLLLCFGPVVDDGYGVCYNPMPQYINFCVSSWKNCAETDSDHFISTLRQSLHDAAQLLIQTQKSNL